MTSVTMYSEWTAPTMLSSMWAEPESKGAQVGRRVSGWVDVIDRTVRLLYPLVATAAVVFAALMWPGSAHSDPGSPSNTAGVNAGPANTSINELAQQLCPLLVKPGSNLAAGASQLQGNNALTSTIAGVATGMAIQMECPAIMAQLADRNVSTLMDMLNAATPTVNAATPTPFQLPRL